MRWYIVKAPEGEERGRVRYPEDAAALVSLCPNHSYVTFNGKVVWTEGSEEIRAGESYDEAGALMASRAMEV